MTDDNLDHIETTHLGSGMSLSFGYKNFEEMMADMRRHEDAANARKFKEQDAMIHSTEDQWFINLSVNPRELFIAGEAWSLEHAEQNELEAMGVKSFDELDEEKKREFKASSAMFRDSRKRGYIFGNCFSAAEPRGELGSTHVSVMWPISKAAFDEAREQAWTPDLKDNRKSINIRTALAQLEIAHRIR